MLKKTILALGMAVVVGAMSGGSLRADALVPNFSAPAFFGEANTTYQEWQGFSTESGLNLATAPLTGNTATWQDVTAATDGAFLIGAAPHGHVYSFSGNLSPEIVVPTGNLGAGYQTTVVLQVETVGGSIPKEAFTLRAVGGTPVEPLSATVTEAPAPQGVTDDWLVTWTVSGDAARYTLDYPVGTTSISQVGARVDTLATAVPEAGSLGMLGVGLGVLVKNRRRMSR